jgi:hypothetical protein
MAVSKATEINTSVGAETAYGMNIRGVRFNSPQGQEMFHGLGDPHRLLHSGYWDYLPAEKVAEA